MTDEAENTASLLKASGKIAGLAILCGWPLIAVAILYQSKFCGSQAESVSTWGDKFICDLKVSDFAIAWFTYVLAIVTAGLWASAKSQERVLTRSVLAAEKAALAAEASAKALPSIERAYLFASLEGTGGFSRLVSTDSDGTRSDRQLKEVGVAIQNFGRTPAVIDAVYVTARLESELNESVPAWISDALKGRVLGSDEVAKDKLTVTYESDKVPSPSNSDDVALVQIDVVYHDVFGQEHFLTKTWEYSWHQQRFIPSLRFTKQRALT